MSTFYYGRTAPENGVSEFSYVRTNVLGKYLTFYDSRVLGATYLGFINSLGEHANNPEGKEESYF